MEYQTFDALRNHLPSFMQVIGRWIDAVPWFVAPWLMLFVALVGASIITSIVMWYLKVVWHYEDKP